MSPDERKTESILLKERWNLTQSGVPKRYQDSKFLYLCQTTSWDSQKFSISALTESKNEPQLNGSDDSSLF